MEFGCSNSTLSAICAIKISQYLGVAKVLMVSFDACVNGITGYASCVGKDPATGGDPNRFLKHMRPIMTAIDKTETRFIIPE
jgi:hypothetical protein